MSYIGWEIPEDERAKLLALFPPRYPDVIAHHITQRLGGKKDPTLPKQTSAFVIGKTDNGEGLETLIVAIDGETLRPDGKHFHITWSLDRETGWSPRMSAGVIATHGWSNCEPIRINIIPKLFEN